MHSACCANLRPLTIPLTNYAPTTHQPLTNYAPTTHRESASYGPNILVASGSYLLLSISVSDSAGNLLVVLPLI